MFGNNSKKEQRLSGTGIGKAVRMPLRAIVALASSETLFCIIITANSLTTENEDNLTISLVTMITY